MQTEFEPHCFYFKNNKTKVEFGVRRDQVLKGLLPSLTACLVGALQAYGERPESCESCEGVNGLRKSRGNGEPALSTLPSQAPVAVSEQSPKGPRTASLSSGHPLNRHAVQSGFPELQRSETQKSRLLGSGHSLRGLLNPKPWPLGTWQDSMHLPLLALRGCSAWLPTLSLPHSFPSRPCTPPGQLVFFFSLCNF